MSILMSQFNLYLWGINSQNLSFLGYMLLSHLQHTPTNTVNACRRKNRLSWEPLHHFTWSKWIIGFKIDLYWHANFHPNCWRNDEVEILDGMLEVPQCKFLCNSKAWWTCSLEVSTPFQHDFQPVHNPLYPLPSIFPNTCSIPPFLLYLPNHLSNLDILSTYIAIQSHKWAPPNHSTPLLGFICNLL